VTAPTWIHVGGLVDDGSTPYDVLVGHDLLGELPGLLGEAVRRVAVIHPPSLSGAAERLRAGLTGLQVVTFETPDAEGAKTAAVAAECWAMLGSEGFTRSDAVVGLGGGATTDLAGFVAATWLRGVRVVHIPTTLLGMVDAAVGGKTGINTAEGKNLVGAFHAPAGVLCDLDLLTSLARADYASGLAEVVKCGFVADPVILDLVEADPDAALRPDGSATRELVERAVRVKADVVSRDLRERSGSAGGPLGRETLNYGHTFGHAVEQVEDFRWRHGEAVAVGLVYVAELARLAGRIDAGLAQRHADVLASLGLPTAYPPGRWPQLHAAMRVDKKARGDRLRFVVLDGLARPGLLEGPPQELLTAAYGAISATS
jgi:3-dehydroquinate synthase